MTIGPVTYTDIAADTISFAAINWFDGTIEGAASSGGGTATFNPHTYATSGVHYPEACLQDDDGYFGCDTTTITVANVAPDLFDTTTRAGFNIYNAAGGVQIDFEPGELVVFKGSFYDPGVDSHIVAVDLGGRHVELARTSRRGPRTAPVRAEPRLRRGVAFGELHGRPLGHRRRRRLPTRFPARSESRAPPPRLGSSIRQRRSGGS